MHTFDSHSQAIWSVDWHTLAPFLATASLDRTVKVWDLNSLRCRSILRGHCDSVNSVEFLINSNILLTSSADKTIGLWDARTVRYLSYFGDDLKSLFITGGVWPVYSWSPAFSEFCKYQSPRYQHRVL